MKIQQKWFGFISLLLAGLLITGCNASENNPDANENGISASPLQISAISTSLTVDENRLVLALWDGENRVADAQNVHLIVRDPQSDEQPIVWEGDATNYSDYEIPYWVAYPDFTRAGAWFIDVVVTQADAKVYRGAVAVNVYADPQGIPVGGRAFPSESRVWDGESDLALMTTAENPQPVFYEKTIAEALNEDKPLVIAFTTPGLCQSKICAPVMRSVEPLQAEYGEAINFIHIEVYADFETLDWVEAMREWGLITEPWLFVISADDEVVARFDGPVAVSELEPVLQSLLES